MVSISQAAIAAVFTVAAVSNQVQAQGTVAPALAVGDYYRPSGADVSGVPGTTAPYRRSPCPALNALSNHGYLPRSGQNITRAMFKEGIMSVYNVGVGVADFLVSQVPETLSLDYLGTHNFIEHDASLAHYDAYESKDPSALDPARLADLLAHANSDGRLGVKEMAAVRKARAATCKSSNPNCDLGIKPQFLAFAESSLLLLGLGNDKSDETIRATHVQSFFAEEKIPADYTRPTKVGSWAALLANSAKIKTLSLF